jgi:hypothetical protein
MDTIGIAAALRIVAEQHEVAVIETDFDQEARYRAAVDEVRGFFGGPIVANDDAGGEPSDGEIAERVLRLLERRLRRLESNTNQTTPANEPIPSGVTVYMTAKRVMAALGCKRAKAYEELRKAAGRTAGTGTALRVTVEQWEAYRRHADGEGTKWDREDRRGITSAKSGAARSGTEPSGSTAIASRGARGAPTKRQLGPFSRGGSVMPLIRPLRPRKV